MFAIRQHEVGGPEVLRYERVEDPEPGKHQVRIAMEATGVHLLDTSIRAGTSGGPFPLPELPMTPGREVAGTVDAVGPDVDRSWIGQRMVAHLGMASGGYAELAVADVNALHHLPDGVDVAAAVAMVGTGRTAMAILDVAAITGGDVVAITAAAGGIGALLVQAAKHQGATVLGLVGTKAKVPVVEGLGADVTVEYSGPDWPEVARDRMGDRRITVALDGVGGPIGRGVLDLVAPGGRLIMFGYSSGEMIPLSAGDLYRTGVTVSAAIGARINARPGGINAYADDALGELAAGRLTPLIHPPFRLADAGEAHAALEARETTGKVVLIR
jgi:NADPH:quinone reductase